ncbi:probable pathogenesis-related protein CaO19.6200 [Hordeum vulgare subsp. vulgare]|uniref:SCP domain-containing protein n=1 Tax=Hordeum vulgare subsp. vulgare TaxID=112509 RepID=A0A8I7B7X7_HORVV|nr:probable pathogenesis-related protein CaO19.6200 [Hordeum vulgare subsp. vulgare]
MHADQLVPAVVAAVAVLCLLIAGRADGQDEYVPAAAGSEEAVEPQPGTAAAGGEEYVPQPGLLPGASLAKAFTGGYFPQQPKAEPEPEQTTTEPEPEPEQTTREPEPITPTRDQGDFYRTGVTPTAPEPPAMLTSPETWEKPWTPFVPKTPSYVPQTPAFVPKTPSYVPQTPAYVPQTPAFVPQTPAYVPKTPAYVPQTPAYVPQTPAYVPQQQSGGGGSYAGGGGNKQVDDDGEPVDGLSPKAIDNILKEHNAFRAKEHVPPLTWNATVAQYAQQYANKRKGDCALKHSTGPYGENLKYGEGKAWTWRHTVDEWSEEKKNYHYGSNSCDAGKQCGHYTAVVWKGTTGVGCGRVTCTTGDTLMVCSYYPPGNYDGEKPY